MNDVNNQMLCLELMSMEPRTAGKKKSYAIMAVPPVPIWVPHKWPCRSDYNESKSGTVNRFNYLTRLRKPKSFSLRRYCCGSSHCLLSPNDVGRIAQHMDKERSIVQNLNLCLSGSPSSYGLQPKKALS